MEIVRQVTLWQDELKDCAILLGANALADLKLFIQMELQSIYFTKATTTTTNEVRR